tara:strand:+ start:2209 stop:2334 length:126 start_codon:yes stop_codon:yes gene_type:complete
VDNKKISEKINFTQKFKKYLLEKDAEREGFEPSNGYYPLLA